MKKILLTGGGGFLGQHLQGALVDFEVHAPRSTDLNLLDQESVEHYFESNTIEGVIHAAGFVGGIGRNKAHPGRMIADNLRMGANLLEAASKAKAHTVVVSTVCVYPENAPIPTPESSMYEGYPSPDTAYYGIAKRTLFTLAEGLHKEFGSSFTYIIPTNLYGPGDYFDEAKSHVVPALLRRTLDAKEQGLDEIVIWGDGTATRDLLYVTDAAKGIASALGTQGRNEVFNIGSGKESSIRELAETICEVVGYEGRLTFDPTKPAGAPRRALDASKARAQLGFESTVSLKEGLANTLDWYLQNR